MIGARVSAVQQVAAVRMLKMNIDAAGAAAQQNIDRLANVAAGIGQNLDITV